MTRKLGRALAGGALLVVGTPLLAEATLDAGWQAANISYKAALQGSSLGRAPQALAALAKFRTAWSRVEASYSARPPRPYADDRGWASDVAAISSLAKTAEGELRSGNTHRAHETLEQVRLRWMAMRLRNGVASFGDRLTSFHDPMEKVAVAVKGRTPAALREWQMAAIRDVVPVLKARWARVAGWRWQAPDPVRDGLIEQLSMTIDELEAASAAGDRAGVVDSGSRLKPAFARLYMLFG